MATPEYTPKYVARFWSNIDIGSPDECWNWKAYTDKDGYGQFQIKGKKIKAHRMACELNHGIIPVDLQCLHSCDNPSCCNPAHLFIGTTQENTQDKMSKGRHIKGETCGRHKLTLEQVAYIRSRYNKGNTTQRILAREMGVAKSTIGYILSGKTWKED